MSREAQERPQNESPTTPRTGTRSRHASHHAGHDLGVDAVQDIDHAKAKATDIETELTEMGAQDWELVSVIKLTGTIDRYYYRP